MQTRFQSAEGATIAEINDGEYWAVHDKDVKVSLDNDKTLCVPPADVSIFDHDLMKKAKPERVNTYSGYLACHALWPFEPRSTVNVLIGVDEEEEYVVARVVGSRLVVASAEITYTPLTDKRAFVEVLARNNSELPHSDIFENNSR